MNALLADPPRDSFSAIARARLDPEASGSDRPIVDDPRTRILYAEDDASIRSVGELLLTHSGYSVTTASDGAEALAALHREHYDLLITDSQMPRLTGWELIRQARLANLSLPVILASGNLSEIPQEDLRQIGCRLMLAKPFTAEQLISAVHEVLRSAASVSSAAGIRMPALIQYSAHLHPSSHWGINE